MKTLLKIFLPLMIITSFSLYAQTIEGNWECNAAIVEYTYEVREFDSPEDTASGSYAVTASWPSSAAAAAGQGFTYTLKEYAVGDTIAVALVPLVNPTYLAAAGVAMNVNLNDNGTFTINDGSTYPTTETENCSTFATVPNVSEDGTWVGGSGYTHPDNPLKYSMGWGISLSSVFAQFSAADLAGGTLGEDYGVGTPMENWGMVTLEYADEAQTVPVGLEIYWEAHDGVSSGLGVNDAGQLNGFTGVPLSPADTVTIDNIEGYLYYYENDLWNSLGWTGDGYYGENPISFPMLGGEGNPIDPNNSGTFTVDPATGDTLAIGTVAANHGYLFDPAGANGEWFDGDEPLAATGYFFTYNFMEASGTFSGVLETWLGAGVSLDVALNAAADSVASIYVSSDTSESVAASVSSSIYADYIACATAGGGDACNAYLEAGPTMTLLALTQACPDCYIDDSGFDYNDYDMMGRLVFEVDNNCIPDNTTQRVQTFWAETSSADLDEDVPVANKFELLGNYPNPFNPETKIRFATERDSHVKVTIYSILGQKVAVTYDGQLTAGTYNITWNGRDSRNNSVPSGVYYYKVESDDRFEQGKMLLLK